MNDLNDPILLLWSHSVIGGEAETSAEKIAPTSMPEPWMYAFVRPRPLPSAVMNAWVR